MSIPAAKYILRGSLTAIPYRRFNHGMKTFTTEDFKRWGKIGGKRRAKVLTPEQRQAISRKGGKAKGKAKK
jgi:hypothetical protein